MTRSKGMLRGVGMNDADYHVNGGASRADACPYYARWKGIIQRCYGGKARDHSRYGDCTVDDRWHSFMVFKSWMVQQPWQGNQLDKDILCPERKIYAPETSVFIPGWLNVLMVRHETWTGLLLPGVHLDQRPKAKQFQARVHDGTGKRICIGSFKTEIEAHKAWSHAKADVIAKAIDRYQLTDRHDDRVSSALMRRVEELQAA